MEIVSKIKSNPKLKQRIYNLIVANARPRWWVRNFVTPIINHRGKSAIIRKSARLDIFPFQKFSIGDNSTIEDFTTINNGVGDVIIGNDSRIGIGTVLIGPIKIGNQVILAQNIAISGLNHTYSDIKIPIRLQKVTTSQIIIEDEVWIGANAVITAGITIGKHSVIAGGAVVTKNIPPYSVAVGNPAKVVKQYDFTKSEWVKIST